MSETQTNPPERLATTLPENPTVKPTKTVFVGGMEIKSISDANALFTEGYISADELKQVENKLGQEPKTEGGLFAGFKKLAEKIGLH